MLYHPVRGWSGGGWQGGGGGRHGSRSDGGDQLRPHRRSGRWRDLGREEGQ